MASLVSLNTSTEKGTTKKPIPQGELLATGLAGDAHAGAWHRQVSLLSSESIRAFGSTHGREYHPGDFAENLTTLGLDLAEVGVLDRIQVGDAQLEVTQIGKSCHGTGCAIFREVGKCVMPKAGIFCRVLRPGTIRTGDPILHEARPLPVTVLTLSDRASRGDYVDRSGPALGERLRVHFEKSHFKGRIESQIIPDDAARLREAIAHARAGGCRLLITTGGTGIGPRDITPDVIAPLLDREIPGIMEYIRYKHGDRLPQARLSRSVAGLMGDMLVFTLPGSVRAVNEYLDEILPTLDHAFAMIAAIDEH